MTLEEAQKIAIESLNVDIAKYREQIDQLEKENNTLRRLLANSNADCPYCGLPASDMAKCAHGFPGCSRADDMCG